MMGELPDYNKLGNVAEAAPEAALRGVDKAPARAQNPIYVGE